MRTRSIALVAALSGVVGLGIGARAAAQTPPAGDARPDIEKAREHYKKATEALAIKDYAIAAREFGLAYQITKDPVLFFKIALAHDKAGDCEAALIYYGRYLREGNPSEADRADTEKRVDECKRKLGQTDGGGAAAGGGDAAAGGGAAAAGGGDAAAGGGAAAGGDAADVMAPDFDDAPPTPAPEDRPPTFVDGGTSWQRTAAWVSVGVAVAAATTGAVLGLSASSREEDIETLIDFRDPVDGRPRAFDGEVRRQYEDFVDEGENLERWAKIAWIGAGVSAATAVVFFLVDPGTEAGAERAPAAAAVTPVVTGDSVGFTAGWVF